MKKPDVYLREYCLKLSDDNVKFLQGRLSQRLGGDLAETVVFLSNVKEIDKWFLTASSCDEFYDMIDMVYFSVNKEHERRLGMVAA
jgi:hypothetical protein